MFQEAGRLAARLHNASIQLRYVPRVWGLVWNAARGWHAAWLFLILVEGSLPVAIVQLTREFVDRLLPALGHGLNLATLTPVLYAGAGLAAVLLASELSRSVTNYVRTCQGELVQERIAQIVQEQSARVDLAFYDWPDYFDRLHRAKAEAAYRPLTLIENLGSLLRSGVTLFGMAGVLLPYGYWLPAVLLFSAVPALAALVWHARRQHRWRELTTVDERRIWYCDSVLTSRDTAAELRLFGWGEHFLAIYQALRRGLRSGRLRLARQQAAVEIAARLSTVSLTGSVALWMVYRAIVGELKVSDLVLFYQAFQQGLRVFQGLLTSIGQVYYNLLFLRDLFEFLDLPCRTFDPPIPQPAPSTLAHSLRFRDVFFRYPGSSRFALNGLSLDIPAGQLVALVGANGSGKSTLVKLLCRLYDPQHGAVEWDGCDLRELRQADLRRLLAVLLPPSHRHQGTVRENILLGDLESPGDATRLEAAVRAAEADSIIEEQAGGLDQILGTWFRGGTDLSTGQWQRLGLARTYYRDAPLLVLDEPTNAMDPWAESEWFSRLRTFVAGRTALVITHRLTTARYADAIHVLEHGRLAESGTHEQLVQRGERYAAAWNSQARLCAQIGHLPPSAAGSRCALAAEVRGAGEMEIR